EVPLNPAGEALDTAERAVQLADELARDLSRASPQRDTANCFRQDLLAEGTLSEGNDRQPVTHVALQGVSFPSTRAMHPGGIKNLKTANRQATLESKIRIVSCRLRSDGLFDVKAEFF